MPPRPDGRSPTALRALSCTQGPLSGADGSACWSQKLVPDVRRGRSDKKGGELTSAGEAAAASASLRREAGDSGTVVYASVFGPTACWSRSVEDPDGATFEVSFSRAAGGGRYNSLFEEPGPPDDSELNTAGEEARFLRTVLSDSILMANLPRSSVAVNISVASDDGAVSACAFNAATMALIDSGIPMSEFLCAVRVCAVRAADQSPSVNIIIDPTAAEEVAADCLFTFVFSSSEDGTGAFACDTSGRFSEETYFEGLAQGRRAAGPLLKFMRESIQHQYTGVTSKVV
jgi:exosome complex component RRP46